ncbi:hypothetical protein WN944_008430 [Citrus x changshan-huyou]|uniref:WD repeat protein n=2 Tax=Citrus TaxID=2706 RepID=A0ACB8KTR3_CITSI|nr:WD repeat protein [Citrus sinensis]
MEMEREKLINEEIEEERKPITNGSPTNQTPETVKTKVPEVEIHLYRQGKGPIAVFKSTLVGWEQDQLDVREILDKYGLKSVYAFSTSAGRGVPIRFDRRNGRSMLGYKDGSVVYMDGEPQDSMIKPVTKILFGLTVITLLITLLFKDRPEWINKLNVPGWNFPPWVIACVVIVFTRIRKRTRNFFMK